jgi:hypothetical protein
VIVILSIPEPEECSAVLAGMDQLPGNGHNWTDVERVQIRRLEQVCRDAVHWEMECGHTDAGDPWCVIYDRHAHQIVLHIARIDRRYVVVSPTLHRSASKATMDAAVDLALSEMIAA